MQSFRSLQRCFTFTEGIDEGNDFVYLLFGCFFMTYGAFESAITKMIDKVTTVDTLSKP